MHSCSGCSSSSRALLLALGVALVVAQASAQGPLASLIDKIQKVLALLRLLPTSKKSYTISEKKYDEFITALSSDGLDVNQPDAKGRLAVVEAVKTRDLRYVDNLVQFGALANSRDPATKTSPIHLAFQGGLVDIAKFLLAYGADINVPDASGKKPRDVASGAAIKALVAKWDEGGAQAFEDPPGTWRKTTSDSGAQYWHNRETNASRWNVPPSCAWQRAEINGQPHKYINYVTSQTVHKVPVALAWRLVRQQAQDVWYNYRANISQLERPDEIPDDLAKELSAHKNVRWFNPKTGEFMWEDPKFQTPWREIRAEGKDAPYYYNVITGETTWEAPADLAWKKVPSEEHPGREFFHNPVTGESVWDPAGIHGWEKHDSDL